MTSDTVYESDRKQSVSDQYVADVLTANRQRVERGEDELPVPTAGRYCDRDKKHGLMLMSAKNGMLECGPCGFSVMP